MLPFPAPGAPGSLLLLTHPLTHAPAALRRLATRRSILTGILVLGALGLAVMGLRGIDPSAVGEALTGADPRWLALAIVLYALSGTLSGAMWVRCQEAGGVDGVTVGTGLGLHWMSRAACELLPASLGEGVRVALVRRHPGGKSAGTWRITGGLAGYKVLDGVVTAAVVMTIALATPLPGPAGGLRWTAAAVLAGGVVIALVWRFAGLGRLTRFLPERLLHPGRRLAHGAGILTDARAAGSASLLGLGSILARVVSLGALLAAFGISPAAAGLTFCVIVVAGILPGAPGGAGARELVLVPALALAHGVPTGTALAFSLAIQVTALGTSLVIGLLALSVLGTRFGATAAEQPLPQPA